MKHGENWLTFSSKVCLHKQSELKTLDPTILAKRLLSR